MKTRFLQGILAAILCVFVAAAAGARENGPVLYGYLEEQIDASSFSDEAGTDSWLPGNYLKLRLKGDWQPEERITFHLEGNWIASLGTEHADFTAKRLGFDTLPGWTPGETAEFSLDHAWGLIDMGVFDLQAGKIPIAWGTGYVFNPSARVNPVSGLDPGTGDETPGSIGVSSSVYPNEYLTISGYLAFQDRGRNAPPDRAAEADNLPWGIRARSYAGPFDISLGAVREILYDSGTDTFARPLWATSDGVGNLGSINLYWEAALRVSDPDGGAAGSDWKIEEALEAAAGFHLIPGFLTGVELRGEYFYHGSGAASESGYDLEPVLAGTSAVMGRQYLFGYAEKRLLNYHLLSLGVLTNLGDLSGAVFPEYSWEVTANCTLTLGAALLYGSGEFEGLVDLNSLGTGTGTVDIAANQVYARMRISF